MNLGLVVGEQYEIRILPYKTLVASNSETSCSILAENICIFDNTIAVIANRETIHFVSRPGNKYWIYKGGN